MTRARGKRRATSSTTPQQAVGKWLPEWEMLAYLDYCIMFVPDHRRFKHTVLSHLKEALRKSWSFREIDSWIRRLWNESDIHEANKCDHESIYHHGSKVLSCVQNNWHLRSRIQKRTEAINDHYAMQRYKRSRSTRSKKLDIHISLGNDFPIYSPRRAGKTIVVEVPVRRQVDKRMEEKHNPEMNLSTEEVFHDAFSSHASPEASCILDSDEPQTPSSHTCSSEYGSDDLLHPSAECCVPTKTGLLASADARRPERFCSTRAAADFEDAPSQEIEVNQDLQGQFADLRRQAKFYQTKLELSEKRNAELQRQLSSCEDTIEILKKPNEGYLTKSLKRHINEVRSLEAKLKDRTHLQQLISPQRKYPIGPDLKELEECMNDIETGILNLSASSETICCCSEANSGDEGKDLSYLCNEAFGKTWLPQVPFQSLVRSLTSVAVGKWVFENEFDDPYFMNNHRGETLLKHLATSGGEELARNLDFATLASLIESDYCQNVLLPKQALTLAKRLSNAVGSLMKVQGRLSNWPTYVVEKWERKTNKLKKIFETALRIKAKTLVGPWVYEVVLPSSGDRYDTRLMTAEDPDTTSSLVQLVLAPGICRFKQRDKRVDCNSVYSQAPQPQQAFDWIWMAVVSLK